MHYHVFVDNSNVWIEGKRSSAVRKGYAANIVQADKCKIQDESWALDFGKLLYVVTDGDVELIKTAMLFGSKPTDKDSLWKSAEHAGFEVTSVQRNAVNREKKVDTGISTKITRVLDKIAEPDDVFVLVMGDADYMPPIEEIRSEGNKVIIAFWENVSGELKMVADDYINLFEKIDSITYTP